MPKILVVDDDLAILTVFKRILLRAGFSLEVAASYEEALQLDDQEHFDAAIMDIILPDGNGIYLIQKLKVKRPNLLRIMISGSASSLEEAKELKAGDSYFLKPIDPYRLIEALKLGLDLS